AETTPDAARFIFDHHRPCNLCRTQFFRRDSAQLNFVGIAATRNVAQHRLREFKTFKRNQFEALFRTHIHAAPAQNAFCTVDFITLKNRVDPAVKAALRLLHGGLLIEADLHFGQAGPSFQWQHGDRLAGNFHVVGNHLMTVQHLDFNERVGMFLPAQKFINPNGGTLAVGNAVNDQARAKNAIATGEDAGHRSHEVVAIYFDQSTGGNTDLALRSQKVEIGRLPDGKNDRVTFEELFAASLKFWIEPAVFVEYPRGLQHLQGSDTTILAENALRTEAGMNRDALLFCFFNFLDGSRHFVAPFDANRMYFTCAQAQSRKRDVHHFVGGDGGEIFSPLFGLHLVLPDDLACSRAGHVHGHIAPANDNDFFADGEFVPQVYIEEKIDSFVHSVEVNSRNREIAAAVSAHRNQDSIETLRAQIFNGEILSRALVEFQRDIARLQNFPHLRFHHVARQPVLRNSQVEHSSGNRGGLKDGHGVAHQRQVVSGRQAHRTGADDGYFPRQLG